ncbi:MAG TPA: hypothetical protein VHT91_05680 [Kofleriaceae bacterium]|nr:hypothetical protein [Kofleriaceae bacterium]
MSHSELEDVGKRVADLEEEGRRMTRMLELLAERSATPAVRAGRSWDAYAVAIATVIGVLALLVSAYTAYVQRQQLRTSAWPYLRVWWADMPPDVGIHAENTGTGPARVTAVRVTVDNKPVASWGKAQEVMGVKPGGVTFRSISDRALTVGQDVIMLKPYSEEETARFEEPFFGSTHSVGVTVCYCSIVDECWVASTDSGARASSDPEPCPVTAAERFKN